MSTCRESFNQQTRGLYLWSRCRADQQCQWSESEWNHRSPASCPEVSAAWLMPSVSWWIRTQSLDCQPGACTVGEILLFWVEEVDHSEGGFGFKNDSYNIAWHFSELHSDETRSGKGGSDLSRPSPAHCVFSSRCIVTSWVCTPSSKPCCSGVDVVSSSECARPPSTESGRCTRSGAILQICCWILEGLHPIKDQRPRWIKDTWTEQAFCRMWKRLGWYIRTVVSGIASCHFTSSWPSMFESCGKGEWLVQRNRILLQSRPAVPRIKYWYQECIVKFLERIPKFVDIKRNYLNLNVGFLYCVYCFYEAD